MAKKTAKPSAKPAKSVPQPKGKSLKKASIAPAWVGWALAALAMLLYANTLGHDFVLDDFSAIKENWIVKGGFTHWKTLWTTDYRFGYWNSPGSLYRPLTLAMFSVEWLIGNGSPFPGHLVNVLLYGFTAWVLWKTGLKVFSDYTWTLPALATLLFMAHPIHTEVVANIKSRDEIVSFLGSMGGLYFLWQFLDSKQSKHLILALLSYGVGMLAKESGITFLAIYPLTVWFFAKRTPMEAAKTGSWFFIPVLVFLGIRFSVINAQATKETVSILDNFIVGASGASEKLASAFLMCFVYLKTLIFPHPLVSDMGYPQMKPVGFGDWRALAGLVLYVGMGVWALLNMGKRHILAYAILFYLITFSLFSNVLLTIGTSYGERLLYGPSWGFALALAWGIHKILGMDLSNASKSQSLPRPILLAAGILLLVYGGKTLSRNADWKNSSTLYEADIQTSPNCAKLNYHRSIELSKQGVEEETGKVIDKDKLQVAIDALTKTIGLYPSYFDAYGSRGLYYFRLGQYEQAFSDYRKALNYNPGDAKTLSNMGYLYVLRAQQPNNPAAAVDLDSAQVIYQKSLDFDPRFADARRNLGVVFAMKQQFPAAIEQWKEGIKYDADNATLHFFIGSAYIDMGNRQEALPWFNKARELDSNLHSAIEDKLGSPK